MSSGMINEVIGGKYIIKSEIGRGGRATVGLPEDILTTQQHLNFAKISRKIHIPVLEHKPTQSTSSHTLGNDDGCISIFWYCCKKSWKVA